MFRQFQETAKNFSKVKGPLISSLKTLPAKTASTKLFNSRRGGPILFSTVGLGLLTTAWVFNTVEAACECAPHATSMDKTWMVSTSLLSKVPSDKATIGIIPYYLRDGIVYILLGRERVDGGKEKSGKFSDFGGNVELDGTSFADNAIRELKEETMGQIAASKTDLYEKGIVLHKFSEKQREIIYIFYPVSEGEYKKTRTLSSLWTVLCATQKNKTLVECEKDLFIWLNVHALVQQSGDIRTVEDIDGHSKVIPLRNLFVKDCLNHPSFQKVLAHIIDSSTISSNRRVNASNK